MCTTADRCLLVVPAFNFEGEGAVWCRGGGEIIVGHTYLQYFRAAVSDLMGLTWHSVPEYLDRKSNYEPATGQIFFCFDIILL
jgi:hypothetical protein